MKPMIQKYSNISISIIKYLASLKIQHSKLDIPTPSKSDIDTIGTVFNC